MKPCCLPPPRASALLRSLPIALTLACGAGAGLVSAQTPEPAFAHRIGPGAEPMQTGKFEPTWESLKQYEVPEWYRDAKFGIWAHWGPQCEPEVGDWYARRMYEEGSRDYKSHVERYGPPSKFGFKDVINTWKAEKWDPARLVSLYKRVGAKYFFAMANHHDNLDLWDSKYQPWNSVNVGPKKNIIEGWAKAARANGLKFGLSVHAAHAWSWYEVAQGADQQGPLAGVPYDGKLTKADGKGLWWEGLDPQDLYAQNHTPGQKLVWDWDASKGSSVPDAAYSEKFYNRTMDLINRYDPDVLYFDDTALPLYPVSDAGLKIAAHLYNRNMKEHGGRLEAVLNGKVLNPEQRKTMVWDVERGASNRIEPYVWQTDTCIGDWHYNRSVYERDRYKSARTVVHMLADIVSKNGNLLLNIPVRGDGSIDEKEEKILEGIAAWMQVNSQSIYATRPWKIFGEGPASEGAPIKEQGFNEGKGKPFTADDVRFTRSKDGKTLFAIALGWPTQPLAIKALAKGSTHLDGATIAGIELLGSPERIAWDQGADALTLTPVANPTDSVAAVYKIALR